MIIFKGFAGTKYNRDEENTGDSPASLTRKKQTNIHSSVLTFQNWHLIICIP